MLFTYIWFSIISTAEATIKDFPLTILQWHNPKPLQENISLFFLFSCIIYANKLPSHLLTMDIQTFCQCLFVLLLDNVQVVHVGGMMLAVVQLHDLCINMRFQSSIVIWQVRKSVLLPRNQAPQGCYKPSTASRKEKRKKQEEVVLFSKTWALPLK